VTVIFRYNSFQPFLWVSVHIKHIKNIITRTTMNKIHNKYLFNKLPRTCFIISHKISHDITSRIRFLRVIYHQLSWWYINWNPINITITKNYKSLVFSGTSDMTVTVSTTNHRDHGRSSPSVIYHEQNSTFTHLIKKVYH